MAEGSLKSITVHMIGNAHIDPVWLWRAAEGFDEVRRTCAAALDRMEETPGFVFCRSSAATYQWLEEHEPALFERIRQRVAEGRWCVVGGWWEQPDCNLPCGESFVRQALYAKRYFQAKFGVDVRVGYNVDSFGHAGTLPQILRKCGLDSYVFFRPGPHEKTLPAGLFLWQAPDGSQVVTCRPPHHYCCGPDEIAARIRTAAEQAPLGLRHVMCFYGVGDHGGGPTKANIASILAAQADPAAPNAVFSTPQRFFDAVAGERDRLPVVADELQHHARGCYSVVAAIKRANHECEELLLAAERFAAIAAAAFGAEPQQAALRKAWETVLFHQFHDVLAGTSIPEAYDDAWPLLDAVRETALKVITDSLALWGRNVDTTRGASPVVFFNPLGFDRDDVIELHPQDDAPQIAVFDEQFNEVPVQRVEGHLVFRTRLRSLGFACYHLSTEHAPKTDGSGLVVTPVSMENQHLRLEISPETGALSVLHRKPEGANLLAGPGGALVVLRDLSDTWSHDVASFRDEVGRFEPAGPPELLEAGPVRGALRVRYRWGRSTAEQTFYLYDGAAKVDVCLVVDWHERHKMLKLAFPTAIERPAVTAEVPYGSIARTANGEEEPIQRWLDLSGTVGSQPAGLAVLNDGIYGADVLGAEIRLSLLRSPIYAFHDPRKPEPGVEYQYTDQGEHIFRYRLVPHAGSWQDAGVAREAQALNVPVFYRFEDVQDGMVSSYGSAVEVKPDNLLLTVLKKAEEGDGLIVRFVETAGRETPARVDVHFAQAAWTGRLRPFEIKTLRFDLDDRSAVEVNMLERDV
ncbi:MAG TPA: glycoside hydrolase family 38 C-terminal domain-containing protein [Planctomycetota bacterium]|nr:glycoside hydrolase family 38 C-terminal domain-containing protein [Planctomycetota bacterium]HRR80028.1 glycoside hydrolase family 38 C-terminal domain-containing protein [Planctomycetota bacterium]HRT95879.1 glycoside hydrolase family 38 C-terminal domain-containing protein [Planctomycetota bacterium]